MVSLAGPQRITQQWACEIPGWRCPSGRGRADDRGAAHPHPGRPLHPGPRPVHRRRPRRAARPHPGRGAPPSRRALRGRHGGTARPAGLRKPGPRPSRQGLRAHRLRPRRLRPGVRPARRRRAALDRPVGRRRRRRAGRGLRFRPGPARRPGRALSRGRDGGGPAGPGQGPRRRLVGGRVRCYRAQCSRPAWCGGPPAPAGEQLCQHHCPVAHTAGQFPQLCEAEAEVFSELLGTHVQRLATIAHGDGVCTTFIPRAHQPAADRASPQDPAPRPDPVSPRDPAPPQDHASAPAHASASTSGRKPA